ncbi:chemotaxis protein CheW [Liquorilactobacillus mali]|uniref:Purine-binding chemotaxis protein CheW n=2 Tax=Liquorilactobacillus mali KCTC 3596 = DSM 20444 TaxID=1046596 RepID=A0A0A7RFV2_9LACO|nr:chemotaxis protein CheW [Liquorilactobacillus mali]AJA34085.1 purine-binding chemotaxis protein CheW [Liquorilactobacillus mali KCTC 3596 = DSM 20444]MDC7953947.1 chemotaxis protein CheW [Liquorilactobacillus mali]MDV7757484.1 chemotaxis protein CheW [Liquorilactobacillus mali]QFQ75603.1 chemotaxis protein CheW [Liquorilactobacillus mali]
MQMILFKMNQQNFMVSAESVEEVIDTVEITGIPLAPKWVQGLINLRGSVLTVIGLAELIDLPPIKKKMNILIMKNEDNRKGLLIDEVLKVIDIEKDQIQLESTSDKKYYIGATTVEKNVASVIEINQLIF